MGVDYEEVVMLSKHREYGETGIWAPVVVLWRVGAYCEMDCLGRAGIYGDE